MATSWTALMAQYWSCAWLRTQGDVETATAELYETFNRRPPDNAELIAAIRWLAGPENRQEKCPTLRELIRAVFTIRKRDRPMRPTDTGPAARIANAKAAMLKADTWAARWDALCETCQEDSECIEVDQWAEQRWGQAWADGRDAVRMAMAREWREAANQMDGVRRVA